MSLQDNVWTLTLALLALLALVFLFVVTQAGRPAADGAAVQKKAYAMRRWLFAALLVLGAGVAWGTLVPFPIPPQYLGTLAPQVVKVVGHQWYWEMSPTRLKAGIPVEFDVTSADVNHGFAVYDAQDRLIAQTQAMPGFTNKLVHVFPPGSYRVLCLEYCGVAHHGMFGAFEIVAQHEGGQS
ncbi:MAG TPA: hypothetical protein VLX30_02890 [Burkholderiales bacterium]|nr:hypothetical protein [Burkholderiales bacterium]